MCLDYWVQPLMISSIVGIGVLLTGLLTYKNVIAKKSNYTPNPVSE